MKSDEIVSDIFEICQHVKLGRKLPEQALEEIWNLCLCTPDPATKFVLDQS